MESTPSKALAPQSHRLLYRGSLSLPDSYLLLDGLSFTLKTAETHGSPALLNNSLALTLESLRGLPLHLIGTVRVKDVWIEPPPADISVDIHPDATLTRIYFENLFCLNPITSGDRKSDYGVRVSLTDNNDPATPDLIIYTELRTSPPSSASAASTSSPSPATASTSHSPPQTLHLLAAQILPGPPPPPSFRLPRPDDPTPRRPPLAFGAGAGASSKRKREALLFDLSAAHGAGEGSASKRARDAKGKSRAAATATGALGLGVDAKALGKDARVGVGVGRDRDRDVFKVPSVPVRRTVSEADVFGGGAGFGKGKEKAKEKEKEKEAEELGVERENKNAVKRAVMKAFAREGIGKAHSEFKELFHTTYYGVCVALRRRMATGPLDCPMVEHFVDAHVKMYVNDAPE